MRNAAAGQGAPRSKTLDLPGETNFRFILVVNGVVNGQD